MTDEEFSNFVQRGYEAIETIGHEILACGGTSEDLTMILVSIVCALSSGQSGNHMERVKYGRNFLHAFQEHIIMHLIEVDHTIGSFNPNLN